MQQFAGVIQAVMNEFSIIFLAALIGSTLIRVLLALRHVRHIDAHRARVPAAFAAAIPLHAHQKAADYSVAKTRLGLLETVVGGLLLLVLTLGGGLEWLSEAWARVLASGGYAHGIAMIASLVVLAGVVNLPFTLYQTFVIEERFGFNRMTWTLFFADMVKSAVVGAALGGPLLLLVLWLMARMGELWWLYTWVAWMGFNLLVLSLYPTLIAPIFNKFRPLEDAEIKARVQRLLAKCGFRSRGVFVMDGSRRSSHGNAYFTGFGAAKRIVFFDTLLSRLAPGEIEAVLAHELGHFKLRHVLKRIVWLFGASLALLALMGWLLEQSWFYAGLGVHTPSTAAALALFFLALPVFTFPLAPLGSLYSRRHEYEADAYAAANADGRDLERALVKLYQDNASTLTPDPVHSAFYDSHPPAALRIDRLRRRAAA
jgi:STE24 endopeptidase